MQFNLEINFENLVLGSQTDNLEDTIDYVKITSILKMISTDYRQKVNKYIEISLSKSEEERIKESKKKTGIFTGLYAINQLNNYKMPIWVADFVLTNVGTGAVVGVPGHDKRDFEFAK